MTPFTWVVPLGNMTLSLPADTSRAAAATIAIMFLNITSLCGTKYQLLNLFKFNVLRNSSVLEAGLQES